MNDLDLVLTLALAVLIPLVVHACVVHRRLRRQGASLNRLTDVIIRLTREQVDTTARALRVERNLKGVGERQDSLESRAVSGQRIESAVRVARQGAANATLLKELGLSEAEASLLMRLHTIDNAEPKPPAMAGQAATLARMLAQPKAAAVNAS